MGLYETREESRRRREIAAKLTAEVRAAFVGPSDYDQLSPEEQTVVRAEWAERIEERRAKLDLAEEFSAKGRGWVELDDAGEVVERHPKERS